MPSVPRKKKGVYVELEPDLVERAKVFAKSRKESFAEVVSDSLERHMAFPPKLKPPPEPPPPAPPPEPFPDVAQAAPAQPEPAAKPAGKPRPPKNKK